MGVAWESIFFRTNAEAGHSVVSAILEWKPGAKLRLFISFLFLLFLLHNYIILPQTIVPVKYRQAKFIAHSHTEHNFMFEFLNQINNLCDQNFL